MYNTKTPQLMEQQAGLITAAGCWQVHAFVDDNVMRDIQQQLVRLGPRNDLQWNLCGISSIDHIGAQLLWNCWGRQRPAQLSLLPSQEAFFKRLELANVLSIPKRSRSRLNSIMQLGTVMLGFLMHLFAFTQLLGQLMLDLAHVLRHRVRRGRKFRPMCIRWAFALWASRRWWGY